MTKLVGELLKIGFAQCPECKRIFDLDIEEEADEWFHGHDCYIEEE